MNTYRGLGDIVVAYPENEKVSRLSDREILGFTKYCLSVKPRGALANAQDFTLAKLSRWLDHLMIVDYLPDIDNFRYRHYGRGIAKISGFDMTGRMVRDFDSEVGRFFERLYRKAISEKILIHSEHGRVHARNNCDWHRLICPAQEQDGSISAYVCNVPILKNASKRQAAANEAPTLKAERSLRLVTRDC